MLQNKVVLFSLAVVTFFTAGVELGRLANVNLTDSHGAGFVRTSGTHFVSKGKPLYANGLNAYWLMYMASDPSDRPKVDAAFQEAVDHGITLIRTWAFNDGGYRALQISPGLYSEDTFSGLDYVISEAKKYSVYLILSLANNWDGYGGKKQYVQWARERGHYMRSDDDFFSDQVVKSYYKNHIKTVLTRVNTVTGVAYKDDPIIFAWELINEPRVQSDLSGRTFQAWVSEMATYAKTIDSNHMLEIGMEGYYGESVPDRKQFNPGYQVGTDFIANHQISGIDFATIHAYPDQWVPGASEQGQTAFLQSWIQSHIEDAIAVLKKPVVITEFGKSSRDSGFNIGVRDTFYTMVYNAIYGSARIGGPCTGGLFWQLLVPGMESFCDGYEIVFAKFPSTANIISQQSRKINSLMSS